MSDAKKYTKACQLADTIVRRVGNILSSALEQVGSPDLVKGGIEKPRIKSLDGISRKAKEKGWAIDETIEKCWDFVGFRVVCNNLQDVSRAAHLFEKALQKAGLTPKVHDYIAKPQPTGYRAIHITCPVKVSFGTDELTLGCEIQIRTRLQDAWGHLSRSELYRKNVPVSLVEKAAELAETLAKADAVAEEIRKQVTKPRKGEKPAADALLTAEAIAFIYARAFGEEAPDYVVEATLQLIGDKKIRADALDALLQDEAFLGKIDAAYLERTNWAPYPQRVFECAAQAVLDGTASGIALARRKGKADWLEIDAQYKSDLSAAVPETWPELKEQLENHEADIDTLARYFDGVKSCICSTEIVDFDSVVSSIQLHYGLDGDEASDAADLITAALDRAGMDDADGGGLCSYCYHTLHKDD
jgi:ppGpp synthetase/RelA/SpoT-type nucleotidyltranferase